MIYDWFGCGWSPILGLFRPLFKAGGEVLRVQSAAAGAALGWLAAIIAS